VCRASLLSFAKVLFQMVGADMADAVGSEGIVACPIGKREARARASLKIMWVRAVLLNVDSLSQLDLFGRISSNTKVGQTHLQMFNLPKTLRTAIARNGQVISDRERLHTFDWKCE
jgi:hypothetical protein